MLGETLAEVSAWWLTDPIDLTKIAKTAIPITRIYAIEEQRGNQHPKIRRVDDFMASSISAIIETDDTNISDSFGAFVAIASYYKIPAPGFQLMCASMDLDRRGGIKHVV